MAEQLVSFYADAPTGTPPKTSDERKQSSWIMMAITAPIAIGSLALLIFSGVISTGFATALASTRTGQIGAFWIAVAISILIGVLAIASGIMRDKKDLEPIRVSIKYMIIALSVLPLCAACSYAFYQVFHINHERAPALQLQPAIDFEPRRMVTILAEEAQIRRNGFLMHGSRRYVLLPDLLSHTHNCDERWFTRGFEEALCSEWTRLQSEKASRQELDGGPRLIEADITAALPPDAIWAVRVFFAVFLPLLAVPLGPWGLLIAAAVASTQAPKPAETLPTPITPAMPITPALPAQDEIEQAFTMWKERLQWGSAFKCRAQSLYDDFRNYCLRAGKPCWTSSDGKTPPRFGEALAPLFRLHRVTVSTSDGTVYIGVALPGVKVS